MGVEIKRVTSSFYWITVFLFTYLFYFQNSSVSYNYGNLTFLFVNLISFLFMLISIINFYLSIGSNEVLLNFSSCFWFTPETGQDGNKFIILK